MVDTLEGGLEEVMASLNSLSLELQQLQRPLGTAESPGLMCHELHRNHPHLPDGEVQVLPERAGQVSTAAFISTDSLGLLLR